MTKLRVAKVAGIAADIPLVEVDDPVVPGGEEGGAEVLVVGWGSTYGAIQAAIRRLRVKGHPVAHAHIRHLNPFPSNQGEVLRSYPKVLVPEMNLGQLVKLIRADFLVDARGLSKVKGQPFRAEEIEAAIYDMLLDR